MKLETFQQRALFGRRILFLLYFVGTHDLFKYNEKRSAWTCWRSGVKFSHGTTIATGRWRSYDRTNSLRTPTMQENQLLREKNNFLGPCFNMFKRCACPVSLTSIHACTRNTRLGHVTSFACGRNTADLSLAWLHDTKIHAIDRDRAESETWNTLGKPRAVAWKLTAVGALFSTVIIREYPVMTGHNARRPRTGRERRQWWRPSEASYLTVWTLNDRFFASLVHCMLRRLLSEYWRKETEKWKVFCGVVGLDGRCSALAEPRKKPVAVGPLPGAYLSTETNLVPIRGVMKKEFDTGHTRRHAHTRNWSAVDRQGPGASAHVTSSKN